MRIKCFLVKSHPRVSRIRFHFVPPAKPFFWKITAEFHKIWFRCDHRKSNLHLYICILIIFFQRGPSSRQQRQVNIPTADRCTREALLHLVDSEVIQRPQTYNQILVQVSVSSLYSCTNTRATLHGKGPVKIYRVPRPGFGKNLPEKKSSPPFFCSKKSLCPP